jgi:TDG/mug DNA glycosylase family protein
VFSGKKDFCFGKQPETVEGTNTYMWVMPSSSARCAQLPRAADKVPFYGALKKFRDYLNGLIPEYDETEYVFNDPKYSQISTEAELKDDAHAFTTLENGEVIMGDPNKKKRGRPKKVRGENDCIDDDPNKKKRGRPKKVKDGTNASPSAGKKKSNSNKDKALQQQQSISSPMSGGGNDLSSLSHHQPSPSSQNPQLSSLSNHGNNSNTASSNSQTSFLPPIESPTASLNFQNNGAINQQTIVQQSNNLQTQPMSSPVNLCYPPAATATSMEQSELSQHNHVTYQQQRSQIFSNNASPELTGEITTNNINDQITSPVASTSPNLPPSDFEPPEPTANPTQNTNELTHYSQQSAAQSLEQQHHHTHSPLSQSQSPLGLSGLYPHTQSQQQQQQSMSQMMNSVNNSSIYSPYSRQQSTPQQSYMSMSQSPHHPQTPTQNIATNNKQPQQQQQQQQIGQQINGSTTDLFKDVAAKSLSGLESLVDQIPNINEQDTGLSALSSGTQNVQLQTNEFNMISGYSSSGSTVTTNLTSASSTLGSSSLLPPTLPHHHSHYTTYTSHANQSPYSASPFSVSSLTSSTYPSAAAMNNYHQNLMGASHLTSSFMEPHMPVPVSPLYHSYQQQGYPGYGAPPHPSAAAALHMSNYPYYTNMNTGYTQAPGSTYHSMFDRINF